MKIIELYEEVKILTRKANQLDDIISIIGGNTENVVDNVKTLFDNAEPTNPVKSEDFITQLEEIIDKVHDIESAYSRQYDEIDSAINSLEYIPNDLDETYDTKVAIEGLIDELRPVEEAEEAEEETTTTTVTDTTTDNPTTTQQQ